jgi:hypothetical protein
MCTAIGVVNVLISIATTINLPGEAPGQTKAKLESFEEASEGIALCST